MNQIPEVKLLLYCSVKPHHQYEEGLRAFPHIFFWCSRFYTFHSSVVHFLMNHVDLMAVMFPLTTILPFS